MNRGLILALCAALLLCAAGFAAAEDDTLPEAFAHITFDGGDEGYKAVAGGEKDAELPDGAARTIEDAPDAKLRYTDGPVGKALFIDGSFGLDLGLQPTNTDAWTVSFWVNASRLSEYGPTLLIGYNIGKTGKDVNVTWMNVTQTYWNPMYFPTVWSRNVATGSWPWMAPFTEGGEMTGKREWALFTIVCSGEEQDSVSTRGAKNAGAQLYINGELRYDSQENYEKGTYFAYTWDATLAPNIMKPDEGTPFEAYFGIGYTNAVYKGYVDDLYVFDTALNAEQVAKLYAMGTPDTEVPVNGPRE